MENKSYEEDFRIIELRLMELRIQLINWDNFLNIMQLLIFNNCV